MALYSNTERVVHQYLSQLVNDCILATASAGTSTTATIATTDPPQFYDKGDDYFNKGEYELYAYSGTNIGVSRLASDWVKSTHVLTVTPAAGSDYDTTSLLELHRIFTVAEMRYAINQAIDLFARKYFINIDDETTVVLEETTDNTGEIILYTYEYALPTSLLYIHRVTTESSVSGYKLTGTVSGAFTLNELITGGTSSATGILSYGPSGGTYILVREVDGTFEVAETATGGTSNETCSPITAVDDETVGDGRFPSANVVDPRDYTILKSYAPEIKFHEDHYNVVADLRIRLEGQGSQDNVTADTDNIFLPPHDLVPVAATFLPFSKIESANLKSTFDKCMIVRGKVEMRPTLSPYGNTKRVIE